MSSFGRISYAYRIEAVFLRDPAAVVTTIALPTAILVVLGLIPALREPDNTFGGQSFVTYLPVARSSSLAVSRGELMPTLAGYRESGVLRRLATTPVSPAALLAAQLVLNLGDHDRAAALIVTSGRSPSTCRDRPSAGFAVAFVLGAGAARPRAAGRRRRPTGKAASAVGGVLFFAAACSSAGSACRGSCCPTS